MKILLKVLILAALCTQACGQVNLTGILGGGDGRDSTKVIPAISTAAAADITKSTAKLYGYVDAKDLTISARFLFGSVSGTYTDSGFVDQNPLSGTGAQPVTLSLNALSEETNYFYKLVGFNDSIRVEGTELSFTTLSSNSPPVVITSGADNITSSSAIMHGSVIPNNLSTNARFIWGTPENGLTDSAEVEQNTLSGADQIAVTKAINNLNSGTDYIYKLIAYNDSGRTEGSQNSFTTLDYTAKPIVTTDGSSNITATSAYVHGTVNPNNLTTNARLLLGTTSGTYTQTLYPSANPLSGHTDIELTLLLTGLSEETEYFYKWAAENDSGNTEASEHSFTTAANTSSETEVVLNGNFESGTTDNFGYTLAGEKDSVAVTTENVVEGSYSIHVRHDVGEGSGTAGRPMLYWALSENMEVGENYILTFRAEPVSGDSRLYLVNYGKGQTLFQSQITPGYALRDTFTCTTLPPAPNYIYFYTDGSNYTGEFTCEVSLKKITGSSAAPVAVTTSATGITTTSAVANGTVNANNASSTGKVLWGVSSGVYTDSAEVVQNPITGSSPVAVSKGLTGLTPNTTYYYIVKASNSNGTSQGNEISFTTAAETQTGSELVLNGTFESGNTDNFGTSLSGEFDSVAITIENVIEGLHSIYVRHDAGSSGMNGRPMIHWYLSENMAVGETYILSFRAEPVSGDPRMFSYNYGTGYLANKVQITNGFAIVDTFTCTELPPMPNVIYFYFDGLNYTGAFTAEVSLKKMIQEASAPTVVTSAAENVTSISALLKGTVNPNHAETDTKFLIGTTSGTYSTTINADQDLTGGNAQAISVTAESLNPNTTYYYVFEATNSEGTVTGSEVSFTTDEITYTPVVTTGGAFNISESTALLRGTVNANSLPTTARLLWGGSSGIFTDSLNADGNPITGSSNTNLAETVTGLESGTTYYYKWVAENDSGRSEGVEGSFSTYTVGGTTYYISNSTGNDANNGISESSPWKSLSKLHSSWNQIVPGDRILLKRGDEWAPSSLPWGDGLGIIRIPDWKDGNSSNYYILGAYGDPADPLPNLSGKNLDGIYHQVIRTGPLHYWKFENLRFEGEFAMFLHLADDQNPERAIHHVEIHNCEFDGRVAKPTRLTIFTGWKIYEHTQVPEPNDSSHLGWHPAATHDFVVKGNKFWNSSGEDCLNMVCVGDNIYVGYNEFYGSNEEFLDIAGGSGHIVEYNLASGTNAAAMKFHSQFSVLDGMIFRGNVLVKGAHAGLSNGAAVGFENVVNCEIYNNTFVGYNNGWAGWFGDMDRDSVWAYYGSFGGNKIKNNIFYGSVGVYGIWNNVTGTHNGPEGTFFTSNEISNNTYYLIPGNDLYYAIRIRKNDGSGGGHDIQIRMDQQSIFQTEWQNKASGGNTEKLENPLLEDPFWNSAEVFGNFRLRAGSPSIDSGTNISGYDHDIEKNPVPVNGTTDRGAYEKQ